MMIEPPIEQLSEKAGNKYKLTNLVAKRALEIQKRNIANEVYPEKKEITEAAEEVFDGTLIASDDEQE